MAAIALPVGVGLPSWRDGYPTAVEAQPLTDADIAAIVCRADATGVRSGIGTEMAAGPADGLQLFNAEDAVLKGNPVVGRVSTGTMAIHAQLTATRTDGSVIAVAIAPTQL